MSESVPRDDTTGNARRTQKIYEDILGRTWKTVVYKWDGTTAYTTTEQKFNGRDQVIETKQIDNTSQANPQTSQTVTMTYDGHGRMKTRHYPIEDAQTETTWSYNPDDSISQISDPRLAITNFTYNSRGLVTEIAYTPPSGSSVPDAPTVTFGYDNLGNRTVMDTAGVNETTYAYDSLSRLTSETVDFDDLANNYTIGYTYHIGGGLKSISDPFNSTINYANDKASRLTAVSGTAYAQNTTGDYASNIQYRAFGEVKRMDYDIPEGDSQIKLEYDDRLRVDHSEVTHAGSTTNFAMKADFTYLADGRVSAKNDLLNDTWDRTNKYDFAGRLSFNQFGMGTSAEGPEVRVYEQAVQYDGFSQLTSRSGVHWGETIGFTETYENGRIQSTGTNAVWDAAGNIISTGHLQLSPYDFNDIFFDASGRRTGEVSSEKRKFGSYLNMVAQHKTELVFDGDGRPVMERAGYRSFHVNSPPSGEITTSPKMFQVWSSVLKKSLTTVAPDGTKRETKVYAGAAAIAFQTRYFTSGQNNDNVKWATADPVTGTTGTFFYNTSLTFSRSESEPFGQSVAGSDPYLPDPDPPLDNPPPLNDAGEPEWQCLAPREFWGGFAGLPFHCQKALLQDFNYGLDEIYGFTNPHNPSSPSKVTTIIGLDAPIESPVIPGMDAGGSGHSLALAAMLNPTSKKDDKKPKPVPESNLPKDPDVDLEKLSVTIRGGPSMVDEVYAHFDASESSARHKDWYIVGFDANQFNIIQDQVKSMHANEACAKAFENAGLQSVNSMMSNGSLVFVREGTVKNESATKWLADENLRSQMAAKFEESVYYNAVTPDGGYNGNYYIGVRNRLFTGGDDTPVNIIIHELIHAGSVNGSGKGSRDRIQLQDRVISNWKTGREISRTTLWRTPAHDLDWMNYKDGKYTGGYDAIIKACQPR